MIGTALDKYEVLQKVGEGGMATVYRGRHATLGRDVAIKVLHPHLSASTRNRKRFAREARAIEELRHPNIVEIFDYSGETGNDCYIVTEFVEGTTLTDVQLRCSRFPSEVVAMVGADLARALTFAHEHGILHRDLKPDNVMVRYDGTIKLMDFGIARFLDEAQVTMTGALVGSPAYMSPEQAREAPLDARSDLFSLGTLLYQLASGQLPFPGSNPSLILKNIIEGQRAPISDVAPSISATLADVIERLLQPDPNHRFPSATAVATALQEVLAEAEIDPRKSGTSLADFLDDPAAFEGRLESHLREVLVRRGRTLLQQGDALAALRLFNRLLSIQPDNPEVLALVQGLHAEPVAPSSPRRAASGWWIPTVLAGIAASIAYIWPNESAVPSTPTEAVVAPPSEVASPTIQAVIPESQVPEIPAVIAVPAPEAPRPVPERRPPPTVAPVTSPAVAAVMPAEEQRANIIFLVDGPGWAEVYCDQRRVGRTRPPDNHVAFAPGTHRCRYSSPHILDEPVEFTVYPGEERTIAVAVRARPLQVSIDDSCDDACTILRDEQALGTVAEIRRTVAIERPDESHTITVQCGDRTWRERYDGAAPPFLCAGP